MFLSKARSWLYKANSVNINKATPPRLGLHHHGPLRTSIPVDIHIPGLRLDPARGLVSLLSNGNARPEFANTFGHNHVAPRPKRWWSPVNLLRRLWRREREEQDGLDGKRELVDEQGVSTGSLRVEEALENGNGYISINSAPAFQRPFPLSDIHGRYSAILCPPVAMDASISAAQLTEEEEEINAEAFNRYFRSPSELSLETSRSSYLSEDPHTDFFEPIHSSGGLIQNEAWWAPSTENAAHSAPSAEDPSAFIFSSPSLSSLSVTGAPGYDSDSESESDYGQVIRIYSRDVDPCLGLSPFTTYPDADNHRLCPISERPSMQESLRSQQPPPESRWYYEDGLEGGIRGGDEDGGVSEDEDLAELGLQNTVTPTMLFLNLFPCPIQASIGPNTRYSLSVEERGVPMTLG